MKKLKLEDYPIIKPYLDIANYEGYNSNFVTMMMWNHEYHIEYKIINNKFLIMLHNYKGIRFWSMPFTTPKYYKEAIDYMIQYSHYHQFDFLIDCATKQFVEDIKSLYTDQLLLERTRFNDDYIYDRQMMQSLKGKKMQKRRNHYNAFLKEHPDYVYRDLDLIDDFDTVLECLNRWELEKEGISESMTSEVRGIMSLLSSNHLLDFQAGGIFIDGKMEAFIIGSKLPHSTIQIHVEKANKEIRGLYPAILKEFLEHHYPEEKYINREEDMGLENLRQSKQSLHPISMVEKYRIKEKHFSVSKANANDKEEIIKLWSQSFKDEDEKSTQYYFQYLYSPQHTYVLKNNQELISVLQIKPMDICTSQKVEKSYFILGVCTKESYQNQHCMKYLLKSVLSLYKNHNIYLQAYIPEIYKSFGFYTSHLHKITNIDVNIFQNDEVYIPDGYFEDMPELYEEYVSHFELYKIRYPKDWNLLIKRLEAFNQKVMIFKDKGYMIYLENDSKIYISEFIYTDSKYVAGMLLNFKDTHKDIQIESDLKLDLGENYEKVITMMSNRFSVDQEEPNYYINEVY